MKICIIGASGHVNYVFEGLALDSQAVLSGIAAGSDGEDITDLGRQCAGLNLPAKRYRNWRAMLDTVRPDVAVVAPYFCDHAVIATECLQRGCHVFMEKPVALSLEELKTLASSYAASHSHLAAMHGLRYDPALYAAWKAVQAGFAGTVRQIVAQKSYKLGSRPAFYRSRATYGGSIPWAGSHAIDWIYWFGGARFRSVSALHSALYNRDHGDMEVCASCQFSMDNETIGLANIDYLRPRSAPTHGDDRVRIAGTDGIIEVRDGAAWCLLNNDGERELPLEPKQSVFADFLKQIRGEGACRISADDSLYVTEACLRAREAADNGCRVVFD